MAKLGDWYAACPHCKGSGSSNEPKEPRVHYNGDGTITPNPKYTPKPSDGKNKETMGKEKPKRHSEQMGHINIKEKKSKRDTQASDWSSDHKPKSKDGYPNHKPKDNGGGSSIIRKPKPKSPAGGAAKTFKK
jgi:hypothetical protein